MDNNDAILDWVEKVGGGYVWEAEIFAINLLDVALTDKEARNLCKLSGIQQIALNRYLSIH